MDPTQARAALLSTILETNAVALQPSQTRLIEKLRAHKAAADNNKTVTSPNQTQHIKTLDVKMPASSA